MKQHRSFFRIIIIVILISSVMVVLLRCSSRLQEFRITGASFAKPIIAGPNPESAEPQDLVILTSGSVHYPLLASFWMIDASHPGDYNKAQVEIQHPGDPIVLEKFYKFYGFTSPVDVVYGLTLEEENPGGKKTAPYNMHIHVNTP